MNVKILDDRYLEIDHYGGNNVARVIRPYVVAIERGVSRLKPELYSDELLVRFVGGDMSIIVERELATLRARLAELEKPCS